MPKKVTSFSVDKEVWDSAKHRALDLNKAVGEYLEDLIKADLKKRK